MIKVFLGGTCNDSKWRDYIEAQLKNAVDNGLIELFNPVVPNWNEEAYQKEMAYKKIADFQLFVITPRMTGVFSIAEAVDCSNKYPEKTIFCTLAEDIIPTRGKDADHKVFDEGQLKSLNKVSEMIKANGGESFDSLDQVVSYLVTKAIAYKV